MSRYSSRSSLDSKIYVGDLPKDATEKEIEKAFSAYGPIKSVWVARNPAGFAFVEFDDTRDAEDAVRSLDGANICGVRARVEFSTGKSKPKPWQQQQSRRSSQPQRRGFDPEDRCYECGARGHYAYDCEVRLRKNRRNRSGSRSHGRRGRSRSNSRGRSRSRSRSARRYSRSRSRSETPPRRRSPSPRRRSDSPRRRSRTRSRSHSRSD